MKATVIAHTEPKPKVTNNHRPPFLPTIIDNNNENKELSTALRRRRDRYARQAHHIIQQEELLNNGAFNGIFTVNGSYTNNNGNISTNTNYTNGSYVNKHQSFPIVNGSNTNHHSSNGIPGHEEEDAYINRAVKTLNFPELLKNGLFIVTCEHHLPFTIIFHLSVFG